MRILLAFVFLLGLALPAAADDDAARALEELRAGRILPVETIVAAARQQFGGDLLDVELEDEDEGFVYEIKLLAPDGRILKLEYDAATGALLHRRGRHEGVK